MIKLISYYQTSAFFFFSSEKCPIIFKAYNSQLVYMWRVIHSLQHVSLFTTVHNRHCFDPEFHFSTYIAFNKSFFFFWRGIEILDWSWERLKLCVFFILNLVFYEKGLWLKACKNIFGLNWLFGIFFLCVCMPVYFWDSFNVWHHLLIITLYLQTKTPINFLCRQELNPKSLIQP